MQWSIQKRSVSDILFYRRMRVDITKGVHLAAKQIWEGKFDNKRIATKVFFGRHELRHLLDWESIHAIIINIT